MSLIARIASLSNRDRITTVGMALTGIWLFLMALFWLLGPAAPSDSPGGVARLVLTMGMVLPVALIWLGVSLARQLAELRAEAQDLRARLARMRGDASLEEDLPLSDLPPQDPAMPDDARAEPAQSRAEPASRGDAPRPRAPLPKARPTADQRQAALRLDPQGESVDPVTLIRALNFPDGPDDHDAIDALRHALQDPAHSRVLRAAQDVVTLMAGRDVYMDDLPPESARPDVWRRFAAGERGSAVAALGGIHNPDALEIAAAMLAEDEIFRDTAHHFLRHFDGLLAGLVPALDDMQIAVLADSRSARAFMLLGRVSGVFG
ncbi:MAG: type II secretion system protein M [Paracoccus sp.]|nr:type II secretion system protein M [Paracoccus sp. (in: a-proteobacteria)]